MRRTWFIAAACALLAWTGVAAAQEPTDEGARMGATEDSLYFEAVDDLPKVVKQVPPRYPETARKRGQQGTVFLRALVNKRGRPAKVSVIPGKELAPDLDKAAVNAVRQWEFTPAKAKGKPVEIYITIPVAFRLADK